MVQLGADGALARNEALGDLGYGGETTLQTLL